MRNKKKTYEYVAGIFHTSSVYPSTCAQDTPLPDYTVDLSRISRAG